MLYVLTGILILFILACVLMASALTGGRRQTLEESMRWQSEKYDTSFYDGTEKEDYTVQADGGYLLHVQLLKAPESSRYVIITHGFTDNRMGALKYARLYLQLGSTASYMI